MPRDHDLWTYERGGTSEFLALGKPPTSPSSKL